MATEYKTYAGAEKLAIVPLNTSGCAPLDLRVLILPDPVSDTVGSGLIIKPPSIKDQEKWAMMKATVIAVGENAWEEAEERAHRYGRLFTAPKPGDRVLITKHGGTRIDGIDGVAYTLCNDDDIIGRLEE